MKENAIALRMDDIFASSKQFEVYGKETVTFFKKNWPVNWLSNFLWLKYCPGLRHRLPYRELTVSDWEGIFSLLRRHSAKLTLGVTASWVEADGRLIPFYEKFPQQAAVLKRGLQEGLIEIANHGLTHCVVGKHLPRPFASNRNYHREFWSWIPEKIQQEHLKKSQEHLAGFFGCEIVTFIPPGNVWTEDTERIAAKLGIKYLSSRENLCPTGHRQNGLTYIGDACVVAFHDREVVLYGLSWLEDLLNKYAAYQLMTIKEIAEKRERPIAGI